MISNFQQRSWYRLFSEDIPNLFASKDMDINGNKIHMEPVNLSSFLDLRSKNADSKCLPIKFNLYYETPSVAIAKVGVIENIPLCECPIFSEDGFIIDGCKYGITNTLDIASGWYLEEDPLRGTKRIILRRGAAQFLTFTYENGRVYASFLGKNAKTSAYELLSVLSGQSFQSISDLFEPGSIMSQEFAALDLLNLPSNLESASTFVAQLSKTSSYTADPVDRIRSQFYKNYARIGAERVPRLKLISNFYKCKNMTLMKPVQVDGLVYPVNTVLTEDILIKLDNSNLKDIYVKSPMSIQHVRKFKPLPGAETLISFEEIVFALHVLNNFVNGIGTPDSKDALYNKILKPVSSLVINFLNTELSAFCFNLAKILQSSQVPPLSSLRVDDFLKEAKSSLIKRIKASTNKQMLEEINSLAKFEQNFRVSNGSSDRASESQRDIQSSQYGRICPYTTSESKKVGVNLSLAISATIDEYGFIETPLREFKDGVLSEPKGVTAIDEYEKIIAPGDVDLLSLSPDAIVRNCRFNGAFIDASVSRINYQDTGTLQSMGLLLSMVPGVERDAGKRLIMTANAQKQALPAFVRDRPLTTTGVESMFDIGVTTAQQIVEDYYSSTGRSINSIDPNTRLFLMQQERGTGQLVVTFTIRVGNTVETVTRYLRLLQHTLEKSLKHTRLKPPTRVDNNGEKYYAMQDIVIYENDIDLSEHEIHSEKIHYGNQEISTEPLRHRGIALGNNVKVLFKLHEGYGYEDSVIVNEDFVNRFGIVKKCAVEISPKIR